MRRWSWCCFSQKVFLCIGMSIFQDQFADWQFKSSKIFSPKWWNLSNSSSMISCWFQTELQVVLKPILYTILPGLKHKNYCENNYIQQRKGFRNSSSLIGLITTALAAGNFPIFWLKRILVHQNVAKKERWDEESKIHSQNNKIIGLKISVYL